MTLFRPHRSTLAAAMQEVVDLPDLEALVDHLNEIHAPLNRMFDIPPYRAEQVDVQRYSYDGRVGWQTYIVLVDGKAVGFTDGPLKRRKDGETEQL